MSEADAEFNRDFSPCYGEAVPVAPGVERITVNNPSPFTFYGTNSYIVGDRSVCVIDPGPENENHFHALCRAGQAQLPLLGRVPAPRGRDELLDRAFDNVTRLRDAVVNLKARLASRRR